MGFDDLCAEIQNVRADMPDGFDRIDGLLDGLLHCVDGHIAAICDQLDAAAAEQQRIVGLVQRLQTWAKDRAPVTTSAL